MPELPEVETIVRALRGPLQGRRITGTTVRWPRSVCLPADELNRQLCGRTITTVGRRGKYLVFHLDGPRTLLIHLKMSGNLRVEPAHEDMPAHVHTWFDLDNGCQLRFQDTRKFGRVYLVEDPATVLGRLGPEPLADDFTPDRLAHCLAGRTGRLKSLLLDQSILAGVGNIYADESCFRAGLDPRRPASSLGTDDIARLHDAIRKALSNGIMHQGASIDGVYRGGEFQNHFRVYGRTGEPCLSCGTPIERIVLGGRSTHFCPHCQR